MLDFSYAIPPGERLFVSVRQSEYVANELVPLCQRLKGEVLSCFSDAEHYLENILTLLIAGRTGHVSAELIHREIVRPLNAEKKIDIARKMAAELPQELQPDSELFVSLDLMRGLRNSFAHGAILLQPIGDSVRAYPARDAATTIDADFAKLVNDQAHQLLLLLANWRQALKPVDGIDVEPAYD